MSVGMRDERCTLFIFCCLTNAAFLGLMMREPVCLRCVLSGRVCEWRV